MASQVSPGVVVNEFDFSDYVERISTAIFGVVGWATRGPLNTVTLVTNERQLIETFGRPPAPEEDTNGSRVLGNAGTSGTSEWISQGAVPAAQQYLRQGNQCLVVRTDGGSGNTGLATEGTLSLENSNFEAVVNLEATSAGTWVNEKVLDGTGNYTPLTENGRTVTFDVDAATSGTSGYFKLTIYEDGVVREVYDELTTPLNAPADPDNWADARINGVSEYVVVTSFVDASNDDFPATGISGLVFGSNGGVVGKDGRSDAAGDFFGTDKGLDLFLDTDTVDVNILAVPGVGEVIGANTVTPELVRVAEARGDCIALIEPGVDQNTVALAKTYVNSPSVNSSYAAAYWPWVKLYDSFNRKSVWYPPSGLVAAVMAYNDRVAESWYAPAGFNRGKIQSALDVQYNTTLGEREQLQTSGQVINPIVNFSGDGITVWGQKTTQRKNTALNRVNVRRMLNFAKKVIATSVKVLLFEPNDKKTWRRFEQLINPFLRSIKERRGLFDFKVICDDTTNPPELIDQNQMRGIILMKPTKTAEVITVDFTLLSTGAQFNEFIEG